MSPAAARLAMLLRWRECGATKGEDVLFIQTFRRLIKVYFYKEGKVQHIIRFWDKEENVYGEIRSAGIDFFWFPGVCPETYRSPSGFTFRVSRPISGPSLLAFIATTGAKRIPGKQGRMRSCIAFWLLIIIGMRIRILP